MTTWRRPAFRGRIGVARWDITPPDGVYARSWGAAEHDFSEGLHLPLTGTALAFAESGSERYRVLVSLELGWWRSREEEKVIRSTLREASGLEEADLILHLTHTHAGPVLDGRLEEQFRPERTRVYLDELKHSCLRGIGTAIRECRPAILVMGRGFCDLAVNRDFPDPAREGVWLTGFNPSEAADGTLWVGRVADDEGRILATIVNYACHPTVLAWRNRMISPDFPGAARGLVERETGAPCLFLQGASGELSAAEQYTADPAVADRHGRRLGYAALSVLEGIGPPPYGLQYRGKVESGAPLAVWERNEFTADASAGGEQLRLVLRLKPDLADPEALQRQLAEAEDGYLRERLRRKLKASAAFAGKTDSEESAWIWRLGDIYLCAHPFEAYSELQIRLRETTANGAVLVGNVSNGWGGYLPPAGLYGKDIYEVWQTPFAAGGLEKLTEAYGNWIRRHPS